MGPVEHWVKTFVANRGYGPWYQREAWEMIRWLPIEGRNPWVYLDWRYPSVRSC